jgi:hypothetical protein
MAFQTMVIKCTLNLKPMNNKGIRWEKLMGKNKNAQKNVHECTKFWARFGTPWSHLNYEEIFFCSKNASNSSFFLPVDDSIIISLARHLRSQKA